MLFSRSALKSLTVLSALMQPWLCTSVVAENINYPATRKVDVVDTLHGVKVADPYRWLEDDRSEETAAWVKAQNELTQGILQKIPARDAIQKRLTELWDYEKIGTPQKIKGGYVFHKNDGLQNQSVLFFQKSLNGEARELLNPNTLSDDGTASLKTYSFSDDGKWMAYAISRSGSDWVEWKVRDVQTGKDLQDHLKWSKFSSANWSTDHLGFYYSGYDAPKEGTEFKSINYHQKLYYHKLGTEQKDDKLIYARPDHKKWGFSADVTEDGRYLLIFVHEGTNVNDAVFYKDLSKPNAPVIELLNKFDASYRFVANDGPRFIFKTDLDAPTGRIVTLDVEQAAKTPVAAPLPWKELIPQSKDTLRGVSVMADQIILNYMQDAHSVIKMYAMDGSFKKELVLPGIGSASGFYGKSNHEEAFYRYSSYTDPGSSFRYDFSTGKSEHLRSPKVKFDQDAFTTRQVFYTSKDGTKVPMIISHRKGLKLDGNNPTLLYGYGGFNVSQLPRFSVSTIAWMEMGGVYAVANLRGGGEYGKAWHEAGMKLQKQNVFDDFIYAAEWLISEKYTNSKKLAIAGGSNGGLLVGACMTQRPELFKAALPAVGVLDMLRFHKFTIGWAWISEYGSADNADEFKVLLGYSPYHNLKPATQYPSTMVLTGDHDDRVFPAHSFKFAAALQAAHQGDNPVLIRIETKAGHGAGTPTSKRIQAAADKWAFLVKELNMNPVLGQAQQ